jgi:hypothetical protein
MVFLLLPWSADLPVAYRLVDYFIGTIRQPFDGILPHLASFLAQARASRM